MKRLVFTFLAVLFVVVSCNKETTREMFSLGADQIVQINGQYQANDNSLSFRITEINDSRCPSDVVCVWQGKADVTIEVDSPLKGTITLNTFDNLTDTLGNYSFELKEVLPYPISTKTIDLEEYSVTLKIVEI